MSTPSPLIPQGTFQAQAAKGATNVRVAVATIVAIHIVFFGGLLLQGCKPDKQGTLAAAEETNSPPAGNLGLAPLDSNSLYYPSSNSLPADAGIGAATAPAPVDSNGNIGQGTLQAGTPANLWQATNITTPLGTRTTPETAEMSPGSMKGYTIVSGDTFGRIAIRNHTTVSALKKANPNVDPLRIRPGQKINLPAPTTTAAPTGASLMNGTGVGGADATGNTYTVKAGDTLTRIAKNHGITVSQLRAANSNSLRTSRVNVGQKLKIPARSQASNGASLTPPPNPTF